MTAGDSGGGGKRLAADSMYLQPTPRAASAGKVLAPPASWAPRGGRTPLETAPASAAVAAGGASRQSRPAARLPGGRCLRTGRSNRWGVRATGDPQQPTGEGWWGRGNDPIGPTNSDAQSNASINFYAPRVGVVH